MAEETRRNGGRDLPLTDHEWKPRSKAKSKDYGLRVTSRSLFGRCFISTSWYSTAGGRAFAESAARRQPWRRIISIEHVSRGGAVDKPEIV